jgi:hypothetical protein
VVNVGLLAALFRLIYERRKSVRLLSCTMVITNDHRMTRRLRRADWTIQRGKDNSQIELNPLRSEKETSYATSGLLEEGRGREVDSSPAFPNSVTHIDFPVRPSPRFVPSHKRGDSSFGGSVSTLVDSRSPSRNAIQTPTFGDGDLRISLMDVSSPRTAKQPSTPGSPRQHVAKLVPSAAELTGRINHSGFGNKTKDSPLPPPPEQRTIAVQTTVDIPPEPTVPNVKLKSTTLERTFSVPSYYVKSPKLHDPLPADAAFGPSDAFISDASDSEQNASDDSPDGELPPEVMNAILAPESPITGAYLKPTIYNPYISSSVSSTNSPATSSLLQYSYKSPSSKFPTRSSSLMPTVPEDSDESASRKKKVHFRKSHRADES